MVSQMREALAVIERQAGRMRATLSIAGESWTATEERGRLVYQDNDGLLDLPAPKLYGRHQFENAGTAIAALRVAGLKLPVAAFEAGMVKVEWPARMQRLAHGKLPSLLPPESELWLDGGHNADGGRAVADALADLEERVSRPLVLVVGMLSTKDSEGFLRNFSGLARRIITVPIHQDKAVPAEALAGIAQTIGIPAIARDNVESALTVAGKLDLHPAPRVLITGSLYLAGEVLAANGTAPGEPLLPGRRAAASPESIFAAVVELSLRFVLRESWLWIPGSRTSFAPPDGGKLRVAPPPRRRR